MNVDLVQMHPMRSEHLYMRKTDGSFVSKRNPKQALGLRFSEVLFACGLAQDGLWRVAFEKSGGGQLDRRQQL
jgi:hypothetical protein